MATEVEIKNEIITAIRNSRQLAEDAIVELTQELEEFERREGLDGKSVLQKFYSQWKSGKKGHRNPWNSRVAYLLGLTDKAPEGTFFFSKRRAFARPSAPDIDSDFDYERRHEIIDFLVNQYGRGHVGNIGTYGALKMRSCLTRIIKALDIANAFSKGSQEYTSRNVESVNEILGTLPRQRGAVLKVNDDETGDEIILKTTEDVVKANSGECDDFRHYMKKYPEIFEHAKNIEGLLSIFSVHASGVVLSDVPLSQIAPLRTAKELDGEYALATQFAYEDLEMLGLIKFDILAISTLTVIAETVKMIYDNTGIKLDIENLPLDGKASIEAQKTYDLYKTGNLVGVFQCESGGMQDTCKKVGVDRFEDIMAVISLYRPGPMESIPEYCDRKRGAKPLSYFHPTIEPHVKAILGPTYGVLVYQEQVMKICEALGGMTVSEALVVIKGIGKKKEDIIAKGRKSFINGAVEKGVPREVAEQYWDRFITPFAHYGFNAAHSCCYAYNSYITAFLKANYPEEFMCAYMNVETRRRKLDRVLELEKECNRSGITILPRDINKCGLEYTIVQKKDEKNGIYRSEIRPSIHCKGLSTAAAQDIVENRPYGSIRELAEKTDSSIVDAESVLALTDAKFFKTKGEKLLEEFKVIRDDLKLVRSKGRESVDIFSM